MTTLKKKPPAATKTVQHESYWSRTAKEIGTAAAMAALPIIMNSIAEVIEKHARESEREKTRGKSRQA